MAKTRCNAPASKLKMKAKVMPDEAAFYGPKIDVKLVDAIGRKWQLSTVQFDFTLPRRFGLEYIAEDGKAHQPLMVHRALYGSIERFFGILIEHYAGAFPVWLAARGGAGRRDGDRGPLRHCAQRPGGLPSQPHVRRRRVRFHLHAPDGTIDFPWPSSFISTWRTASLSTPVSRRSFGDLAWKQVLEKVKGETSLDAHELRKIATSTAPDADKAKTEYFETVFCRLHRHLHALAVS
jgi:hypothetical protein